MPSLIKKLSRSVPTLPRIPEPSDSSEDDAILQRLGPDRNRIAWSGENTFSAISPPQNGTSESDGDMRPKSPPRGILRGPATRDQGSVENRTVNGGVISRIGQSSTPTRPRYNRTPVRMTVAGEWALKECETLTTWLNNILKDLGSEPVVDLRKCVGDGVTLVKLAEKTCGKFSEEVDTDINSRQDRVDNLQVCLSHLKSSGVDLTAIDAEDIADGNLKSTLLLIGNIKRKVESDKESKTKTSTVSRGSKNVAAPKMPGAITLPGGMREPPLGVSDYPMTSQRRTSTHPSDDLIPGILRKEETVPRPQSVPPQPLISMTELSSAGVFQRGAEERRQLYSHNNYSAQLSRGAGPRQQTTVKPSVPTSKPLSNAWSNESQKPQASRSFDDGELIVPFPPQPRNALPGGGNSIHQKYPSIPVHSQSNSYIPSRPNDRAHHGSRAEAILNQPNSSSDYPESSQVHSSYKPGQAHNLANYYDPSYTHLSTHPITIPPGTANQGYGDKTRSKGVTPSVDPGEWGHQRGQDNLGFSRDSSPIRERVLNRDESVSSRGRGADGMRDAWNKLYGGRPSVLGDPRPQQSQHHQNTGNYMDMAAKDSRTNATPPSTLRSSPMGQSAQGHGSSPSQLSSSQASPSSVSFPGLNKPSTENPSGSQHTIGPSSKYPDYSNRPLAGKESELMEKRNDAFKDPRGLPPKPFPHANSESTLHEPEASIFDYRNSFSEASSRSVTPPLPPLSNTDSDSSVGSPPLPRASSSTALSSQKNPDVVTSTTHVSSEDKKKRTLNSQIPSRSDKKHSFKSFSQSKFPPFHNNEKMQDSGVLSDVRELGTDSDLPFDIEDTILTVDSIDTEMQTIHDGIQKMHLHGDENFGGMRERLDNLEGLYSEVVRVLGNNPSNTRRRWSLASSDTSSLRRPVRKFKASAGNPTSHSRSHHHHHHKDIKAINRRFQRLESHVVTLARSVAHLSSELRSHNSMVNELESLRKEVRDMKEHQFILSHQTGANGHSSLEHNKGWGPSLTNPKRINKLTQFFGQEPPLMEWFLKNLGYEKFVSNFDAEHIGMLELPYMNEERLEKIGIPMGPRLRILQEAQNCFQHENLNIYIV
ncbi:neuron navigator 3-like isoform X2 [Ostrea edulis]|uniref:neuron navigator 3-like isoform X2 n=1 Tax=Ostrea edulis TaxID=37623 RepID=UPI0024AFB7AE|nr:neuron navigator 3-like isoform X2 [Ostrea edulis]